VIRLPAILTSEYFFAAVNCIAWSDISTRRPADLTGGSKFQDFSRFLKV